MRYRFGSFTLDADTWELRCDGEPRPLQPKVMALLVLLLERRDRVVPKEEIHAELWPDEVVGPDSLSRLVRLARRAVDDDARSQARLRTVERVGYQFVAPVELEGAVRSETPGPAIAADAAALTDPFVGRDDVMETLRAAWRGASDGRGRAVLLAGEPGIGKTRTAEELAEEVARAGTRVLRSWCYEGGGTPPYYLWSQLLVAYAEAVDAETLRETLGRDAPDLAAIAPELRDLMPDIPSGGGESQAARVRLLEALVRFWRRAAAREPLFVLLDDLHWADHSSLAALAFAVPRLRAARLLALGTYRDEAVAAGHPLAGTLAAVARDAADARVSLRALTRDDVERVVGAMRARPLAPDLVDAVWQRTRGNPLFVKEVVRWLRDEDLSAVAAREAWLHSVPPGVRQVIEERLARLSRPCRRALELAAVVGSEFDGALLEEAWADAPDALGAALDEALGVELVHPLPGARDRYAFSHGLVQEVLVAGLERTDRAALHGRVARALEQQVGQPDGAVEAVARHWVESAAPGAPPPPEAKGYLRRAAERAISRHAYHESVEHLEQLLEVLDRRGDEDPAVRYETLVQLATARWKTLDLDGALDAAERAAELARARGDDPGVARAALFADHPIRSPERRRRQLALLEEAERIVGESETPEAAVVLSHLALHLSSDASAGARRRGLSRRAVEIARGQDDALLVGRCRLVEAIALWPQLERDERGAIVDELRALERYDDRHVPETAVSQLYLTHRLETGDVLAADREIERMHHALDANGAGSYYAWYRPLFGAMRALMRGEFADAERMALEAFRAGSDGAAYDAPSAFATQMFTLRMEQGRVSELLPAIEQGAAQRPRHSYRVLLPLAFCESGRSDDARPVFERACDAYDPSWDAYAAVSLTVLASACYRLADAERARRLYALAAPYADRWATPLMAWVSIGSMHWPLGRLAATAGETDRAVAHLDAAIERNRAVGARPYLVRARIDAARVRLRRAAEGDRARAAELLASGAGEARELGMAGVLQEAEALRAGEAA
ncbi:MAG: AAA family ATPase [Myxococcota bacterium]|nr:AAA family ATPase [Myxococcota bacterium]